MSTSVKTPALPGTKIWINSETKASVNPIPNETKALKMSFLFSLSIKINKIVKVLKIPARPKSRKCPNSFLITECRCSLSSKNDAPGAILSRIETTKLVKPSDWLPLPSPPMQLSTIINTFIAKAITPKIIVNNLFVFISNNNFISKL